MQNYAISLYQWFVFCTVLLTILNEAHSLECIYCPEYSTEIECEKMNMSQICINETKCGYARFVRKREDLGELYPEDFGAKTYSVTVKKGCMNEDYCKRVEEIQDSSINSTECTFCENKLCALNFSIFCVDCDESVDQKCAIQTEPIKKCAEGEVCFTQRYLMGDKSYIRRGCMDPSLCTENELCVYCETNICFTKPLSASIIQRKEKDKITERKIQIGYRSHTEKYRINEIILIVPLLLFIQ